MNLLDLSPEKLCEILRCDPAQGLSAPAVLQNRREFGENTPPDSLFSPKSIVKSLFSNGLFCIFLLLCVFSLFTENRAVGTVCLLVAFFCYAAFYFFCMYKAKPLTEARRSLSGTVTVLRGGKRVTVRSAEIVPGDLILLERTNAVPCDGILLTAEELKVCQVQIDSRAGATKYSYEQTLREKKKRERAIVYCGSVVVSGSGTLLVCNTGKNIRKNSLSSRQRAELPRPLVTAADYARRLSLGLLGLVTLLFFIGLLLGKDAYSNVFLLCTIATAVLPELAESLARLMLVLPLNSLKRRGCFVQNYACLDHLLKADRILVDNASYFLDAEIRPSSYFYSNYPRSVREVSEGLFTLISYSRLCCEDKPKKKAQMWYGKSSVDAAICRTAPEFGIDSDYLSHSFLTVSRIPYDEPRGFSAALILQHERCYEIVRGRPTEVLDRCTHTLQEKRSVPLSVSAKARLYQAADQMAATGEVVVAVARRFFRSVPADLDLSAPEYLTFVGFLSFHTPMRAESAEAVLACRKDGVEVLLCTDNDPDATLGIAKNMGFFSEGETPYILTGEKARRMDDVTLSEHLRDCRVFCSLSALGKRSVVLAQKEAGHTTLACTHASSDTLTQEAAEINVVCTHERREALLQNADIVLDSERFELLPELLRCARTVALNSLRVLRYSIVLMVALFSCALFSLFFEDALLAQPLCVLLLGLLFFVCACLSLGADRRLVTSLKPIPEDSFFNAGLGELSLYGLFTGLGVGISTVLAFFLSSLFSVPAAANATALISLYLSSFAALVSARKTLRLHKPEYHLNPALLSAALLAAGLLCLQLLLPTVREHLGLLPPHPLSLILALPLSALPTLFGEVYKTVKERLYGRKK